MKTQSWAKILNIFLVGVVKDHSSHWQRFEDVSSGGAGGPFPKPGNPRGMRFVSPCPCRTNNKLSCLPNPGN